LTVHSFNKERQAGHAVATIEGFLEIHENIPTSNDGSSKSTFFYTIGKMVFKTTEEGTKAIDPGQRYRIYYFLGDNEILNLEPVGLTLSSSHSQESIRRGTGPLTSRYYLSATEVSAIIGVPVIASSEILEMEPSQTGAGFINQELWLTVSYKFQPVKQARLEQSYEIFRRVGKRADLLGAEAYYLPPLSSLYIYEQDVFLTVVVLAKHPSQIGYNRERTFKLATALLQRLRNV
jgi:hypothetical protein